MFVQLHNSAGSVASSEAPHAPGPVDNGALLTDCIAAEWLELRGTLAENVDFVILPVKVS